MTEQMQKPPIAMADVHAVFDEFAAQRGVANRREIISSGPPAWFVTGYSHGQRQEALRLELTTEPEALLAEEQAKVRLIQELNTHGSRTVEYLDDPCILEGPHNTTFVATASRYLPGNDGSTYEYGQANGTMHNASTKVDLSGVPKLDQLAKAQRAFDFLVAHEAQGTPVRTDNMRFDESWLIVAGARLRTAYRAQDRMFDLATQKSRPLVVVQEDTHNEQYRRDHNGIVRSFDIDATKSVPEVDLGRARTQWHHRLGQPKYMPRQYIAGHTAQALPEVRSDAEIQAHADVVSLTRFSFAMLGLGAIRLENHQKGAEWFLQEGAHRVATMDDPQVAWHGLNSAMKRKLGIA